jgi:hypothetical protein
LISRSDEVAQQKAILHISITFSLYQPEQHMIRSGITNPDAVAVLSSSSIRALASGDSVWLVAGHARKISESSVYKNVI